MAVGAIINSLDVILKDKICRSVFAAVRPPGHHCDNETITGFCFFNNVAVGVRYAQKELGIKKIAIFDWDVHVGDGTSNIFYDDPSVLLISIHRFDSGNMYPGPIGTYERIGEKEGEGYNIFFGFDTYDEKVNGKVTDRDYIYACSTLLFPILRQFEPELIFVSSGFDSGEGDPLGQIAITPVGYSWMTEGLK